MGFAPVTFVLQGCKMSFSVKSFGYSNETAQHCLLKQSQQFNKHLSRQHTVILEVRFPILVLYSFLWPLIHLFTSLVATILIVH